MTSWATISSSPNVSSFHDVMSEQLAQQIHSDNQRRDEKRNSVESLDDDLALKQALEESIRETQNSESFGASAALGDTVLPLATENDPDTENDLILAQMLQNEWNKEYNALLEKQEHHLTGNTKVTVSLEKYRCGNKIDDSDDDGDDDGGDDGGDGDDAYNSLDDDPFNNILTSGNFSVKASPRYKGGKDEPTKHDAEICGKKNTAKLMELHPEFTSGDSHDLKGVKLSNTVYNKLKTHSKAEFKRSNRLHEKKEHSTADHAVDDRTRLLLYKMVNNGTLEAINGIMAVGKESVVMHAEGGERDDMEIPRECAIKIHKTTLTEFKNREIYVRGDQRFSRDEFSRQNPRRIIKLWASKEKANLRRMEKCGVPCPHVVVLSKHILVMSLIGSDGRAAPQLKNVNFSIVDAQIAYDQTIEIMKKLHRECGLVHADLSQYNLLWFNNQVYVIDVSQSVHVNQPHAFQFLHRDCCNITEFFRTIGVHEVPTPEGLFCDITGLEVQGEGEIFLSNIKQFEKQKRMFFDLPDWGTKSYQFDYFYDLTTSECSSDHMTPRSMVNIDSI